MYKNDFPNDFPCFTVIFREAAVPFLAVLTGWFLFNCRLVFPGQQLNPAMFTGEHRDLTPWTYITRRLTHGNTTLSFMALSGYITTAELLDTHGAVGFSIYIAYTHTWAV